VAETPTSNAVAATDEREPFVPTHEYVLPPWTLTLSMPLDPLDEFRMLSPRAQALALDYGRQCDRLWAPLAALPSRLLCACGNRLTTQTRREGKCRVCRLRASRARTPARPPQPGRVPGDLADDEIERRLRAGEARRRGAGLEARRG
jgi:hypothetical protein